MGLILKQYAGSSVSPKDDAVLYDMVIGKSGVVAGCTITHLGSNQLLITGGYGIIKGRVFVVEEETIYTTLSESGTVKGRLKLRMDISNTEEPIKFITEAAATLPELVQDEDCNYNSGIYEIALATYSISESLITNLKTVYETLGTSLAVLKRNLERIQSHVGMIVHSTTLNTMQKVIEIYGGTAWTEIEGRMLLGASSSYGVNSTGGEASHTLNTSEMPSHNHTFNGSASYTNDAECTHAHRIPALSGYTSTVGEHTHGQKVTASGGSIGGRIDYNSDGSGMGEYSQGIQTMGGGSHAHTVATYENTTVLQSAIHSHAFTPQGTNASTGGSSAHNNMPPYKAVYIWERTA